MDVYSFSGKGKRENNEDFILNHQLSPDCSIHLVADGMGGYLYGEIAAFTACKVIEEYLIANYGKLKIKHLLSMALKDANQKIQEKRIELKAKMGTTIAGALIERNIAYFFWLGDVRIYLFRNNEIAFQSEDHSMINGMKKQGSVSAKEIERYGNIVTRSLSGVSLEEETAIIEYSIMLGDILIICSDGLWQSIHVPSIIKSSKDEIHTMLEESESDMDDNYSILRISI